MLVDLPADQPIDVVFARSPQTALAANLSDPAVVILPDPNNWNDYSRRLFATMRLYLNGQLTAENEPIRLMFEGQDDSDVAMQALLGERGVLSVERSESLFCSLLPSPEAYRRFVERLGFDAAVSALRKMGDAVVVRLEGHDEARLALIDSEAFYVSVLRANNAYAALRRGGRHLRRHLPAPVDDAATSFALVADLPNVRNNYAFSLNFTPDAIEQSRVSVLIGRNGVGKTQLLRHLVLHLAGDYEQPGLPGRVRLRPAPRAQRVLMFSSVASDPYPAAIPPWQGIDYEYFSMTAAKEHEASALLQALMACRQEFEWITVRGQETVRAALLQNILDRMGLWESLHLPLRPHRGGEDYFRHQTRMWDGKRYFPYGQNLAEQNNLRLIREIDWKADPVVFGAEGPRHLSSGELAMFRFAAQAVAAIEQGSLLLFDEPETHLHPTFISDFMEILQDLLDATKSVAIIATHSTYVVREVPRSQVNVLSVENGEVTISEPRLQTFGASIDTISQFVFNDTSVSHRYQHVLSEWLNGPGRDLTIEQIVERIGDQLNSESLSYLAQRKREQAPGDDD